MTHPGTAGVVALVMSLCLVSACGGRDAAGTDVGQRPASEAPFPTIGNPEWRPVENADVVEGVPQPLAAEPGRERVLRARAGGSGRLAGEQFAAETAQLLTDSRQRRSGVETLALVADSDLPEAVRAYLINEIDSAVAGGIGRHVDTTAGLWIRSRATGEPAEPTKLEVEIAAVRASKPLAHSAWYRERFDVARHDDRWSLVDYSGGVFGPRGAVELSPEEHREFLSGDGWRFVPPA